MIEHDWQNLPLPLTYGWRTPLRARPTPQVPSRVPSQFCSDFYNVNHILCPGPAIFALRGRITAYTPKTFAGIHVALFGKWKGRVIGERVAPGGAVLYALARRHMHTLVMVSAFNKQDYGMRRGHEARRVTEQGDLRNGVFEVLRTARTTGGLRSRPDLKGR